MSFEETLNLDDRDEAASGLFSDHQPARGAGSEHKTDMGSVLAFARAGGAAPEGLTRARASVASQFVDGPEDSNVHVLVENMLGATKGNADHDDGKKAEPSWGRKHLGGDLATSKAINSELMLVATTLNADLAARRTETLDIKLLTDNRDEANKKANGVGKRIDAANAELLRLGADFGDDEEAQEYVARGKDKARKALKKAKEEWKIASEESQEATDALRARTRAWQDQVGSALASALGNLKKMEERVHQVGLDMQNREFNLGREQVRYCVSQLRGLADDVGINVGEIGMLRGFFEKSWGRVENHKDEDDNARELLRNQDPELFAAEVLGQHLDAASQQAIFAQGLLAAFKGGDHGESAKTELHEAAVAMTTHLKRATQLLGEVESPERFRGRVLVVAKQAQKVAKANAHLDTSMFTSHHIDMNGGFLSNNLVGAARKAH